MKADVDINPHSKSARGKPLLRKCTLDLLKGNKIFFLIHYEAITLSFCPLPLVDVFGIFKFLCIESSSSQAHNYRKFHWRGEKKKKGYIYASQGVFLNTKQKGRREKNYTPSGAKRRLRNEKAFCSWIGKKVLGDKRSTKS